MVTLGNVENMEHTMEQAETVIDYTRKYLFPKVLKNNAKLSKFVFFKYFVKYFKNSYFQEYAPLAATELKLCKQSSH